jgi:hypothetical protein
LTNANRSVPLIGYRPAIRHDANTTNEMRQRRICASQALVLLDVSPAKAADEKLRIIGEVSR